MIVMLICWMSCRQPIRTRYLGHVTGYQPIRDLEGGSGGGVKEVDEDSDAELLDEL